MAKHRDYWEKRFEQLEDAQDKKAAAYYAELEKQYRKAANDVQREIDTWYGRFAENNELTLQGARKLLDRDELEEFKWSVLDYIEKGKTLNYSDAWAKQLENASTRFHISRLEAIKVQMQNHVEMLYGNELDDITDLMTDIYTEGYYHTAYEIQKGFNIGYDLMKLDENKVAKVLSKPWAADGSNFSDRIWKHKSQLVSELHNGLTQAIIRGQHPSVVTDAIAKRFNVSKRQAGTLVMTESAFFASASNRDCYKDLGVERYEVLATLDRRTSDICQSLDGKVFPMSEYAVGVTAPPFHVRCRTTTVPFFDDEFELDTQRAARDEDGKTYYVPGNMKYEDWKKAFVDGGSKDKFMSLTYNPDYAEIDWPPKGKNITNEEFKELRDYANERGISLEGFKKSDVDLDLSKELIDVASDMTNMFPELKKDGKFTIRLMSMSSADLASTSPTLRGIIDINPDAIRSKKKLIEEYNELVKNGSYPKGTNYKSIIYHEIGHLFGDYHVEYNVLDIAMEVTGIESKYELQVYLGQTLSLYAAKYDDGREILSECFSSYYNSSENNEFVLNVLRKYGIVK